MLQDIERVLISEEELREIVRDMGARISRDYEGKNLLIVSVLKGSFIFMADLVRSITIPCRVDFMSISSYGSGIKSTGVIKIDKDVSSDLTGYDVLIAEDILDSGLTLDFIMRMLSSRGANSVTICTLLDKPERRKAEVYAKYIGRKTPDEFVVGYGLDYAERYRNLPFVGILKPSVYGGK